MAADAPQETGPACLALERSISQHSAASGRSHRSGRRHSKNRKLLSQPSSSASSIAPSDKSLTSFPSFSPDSPDVERFDDEPTARLKVPTQQADSRSIVDSLTGSGSARDALFEDSPLRQFIPGALHRADDDHIQRLVARHGAVALVRQIAEDLAHRDAQIASLRRRTDERERALRRIVRECGVSSLELETKLRSVEAELRANDRTQGSDNGALSDLMSDAMRDTVAENAYGETGRATSSTIRASSASFGATANASSTANDGSGKGGTMKAWKDYLWGAGTAKKTGARTANSVNGDASRHASATVVRSHSSMDRRPTLQEDLFDPPAASDPASPRSVSRASSVRSGDASDRKPSTSLASLALRLVAGGAAPTRDASARDRGPSNSGDGGPARFGSTASSTKTVQSSRATSGGGGPRALMAMRRSAPSPQAAAIGLKPQTQDANAPGRPPGPQESHGPVEMDAILPPESQPPTLTSYHNQCASDEYLTDRFGFIYDQRRKKRQREAAHMAQLGGALSGRAEMLVNGISAEEVSGAGCSAPSDGRPESPSSTDEAKPKRWQDYLRIATFPTELLSHTPSVSLPALEVMEGAETAGQSLKSPAIMSTSAGLMPPPKTTTAVDSETMTTTRPAPAQATTAATLVKEDAEPVRLLLDQLSDVHDSLQRDKTVKWNDFLRKVRAERRRDGEAAVAAAAAAAEARYETPAVILPETRVADGEMIGISDLGNKGKVGRAKWSEFKTLVLGGIPVAYRAKIWSECSGANALRVPGHYEDLVARSGEGDDPAVVGQIQMDIRRTLTDNIFFRKGPGVRKLDEVLLAYSRRNREVGYCQGMNLIAANLLLMTPSAEDAFWLLASVIENILPQGYYDHLLMPSRADQVVLRQYVSTVLPKLSAHLDSLSIELEALTFQWFLSVFTDCLCAEALFRVWDVVLCTNDGSTFLFQVALALLKLNEANLLQCDTPAGVYTYINHHMTEHAISIDGLLQASEGLRRVVRRDEVEQRRARAMEAERELTAQRGVVVINETNGGTPADAAGPTEA
ncbi:TBC domain protein [Ophiocordyceps camponoti-floridani]|uniref:TBC domain protein n=1 Tax=Ophiocordyceps camponoti-floridani TaxID=2030778 RepID=A0A8H4VEU3_9HYPO|nr:TBC domain protein [Ophiocordyceps camponoti-floridani]